jgi:hypothetical protein
VKLIAAHDEVFTIHIVHPQGDGFVCGGRDLAQRALGNSTSVDRN